MIQSFSYAQPPVILPWCVILQNRNITFNTLYGDPFPYLFFHQNRIFTLEEWGLFIAAES